MGQAVVDLPDPLDAPMPAQAVGADDLISQLAGAEIDRLLAEADAEHTPFAKPAVPLSPPVTTPEPLNPLPETRAIAGRGALTADAAVQPAGELSSQINDLLQSRDTAAPTPPPAASAPEPAQVTLPISATSPVVEVTHLSAAEEIALELDAQGAVAQPAPIVPAIPAPPTTEDEAEPSWLIRALEWINTPLLSQPDAFRELIGKVAIVTLLNAFAVLLYVLLFRHR